MAAEPREFSGLLKSCRKIERLDWPVHWARKAELNGREVILVANGAGAARAARGVAVARSLANVESVCSMGFCGALESGMKIGDVFVAESVHTCAGREYRAAKPLSARSHRSGALASIDRVAQRAHEKQDLRAGGASAVEMEAGGVAEKAWELHLPFYCVRAVTDLAEENFGFDFNSALRSDGRFDTMRLIAAVCRRPRTLLPELLRLRTRCRMASETLGEFIASCRF